MYAQSAGMANPVLMSAIAMAESGGNPRAHNAIPPDNSYGLWQINMLGSLGPARRKQYGISSNSQLFDPATNARAAAMILKGQGLKAWSTYTSGAYKKYMPSGASDSASASQAGIWDDLEKGWDMGPWGDNPDSPDWMPYTPPDTDLGDIADIAEAVARGAAWVANPRHWVYVLYVVGGSAVVLMALSATVRQQVITQAKTISGKVRS